MPGQHQTDRRRGAGMLSRLASLLWLVTALSLLQWSAPAVDPSLIQRLLAGPIGEAGLANGDHGTAAVVEARAAPSVVVVEKRSSGGRLLSSGSDDAGIAGASLALRGGATAGSATDVAQSGPTRTAAERPFTARSPPTRA